MSLDDKDRKWAVMEDQYAHEKLGLQILTKRQKQALLESEKQKNQLDQSAADGERPPLRSLQGCHSYDILANPLYFDDF